jgi:hypothetical protein
LIPPPEITFSRPVLVLADSGWICIGLGGVMKARITFSTSSNGTLEVFVNEAGRDLLVEELKHLSRKSDHFHFGPEEYGMEVPVQTRPYHEGDTVHEWGKVLFRPDEWDAQYFPHVLQSQ